MCRARPYNFSIHKSGDREDLVPQRSVVCKLWEKSSEKDGYDSWKMENTNIRKTACAVAVLLSVRYI